MKKIFSLIGVMAILIIAMCSLSSFSNPASSDSKAKTEKTSPKPAANNDDKQYIDLGLPSGTLWATMNVGASKPEDYGDYFAWGETKPKQNYGWNTYKWCNGALDKQIKYCTKSDYGIVDNKTELDLADDAAYVNWGPQKRMPSMAQQYELRTECKWQWTKRNGVNGYLVTSKRNSASVFLPAAGGRWNGELGNAGSYGYYWSRTLYSGSPYRAYYLDFSSDGAGLSGYWGNDYRRYLGQSVRAVRVSQK